MIKTLPKAQFHCLQKANIRVCSSENYYHMKHFILQIDKGLYQVVYLWQTGTFLQVHSSKRATRKDNTSFICLSILHTIAFLLCFPVLEWTFINSGNWRTMEEVSTSGYELHCRCTSPTTQSFWLHVLYPSSSKIWLHVLYPSSSKSVNQAPSYRVWIKLKSSLQTGSGRWDTPCSYS